MKSSSGLTLFWTIFWFELCFRFRAVSTDVCTAVVAVFSVTDILDG